MLSMKARDIMTTDFNVIKPSSSLKEAIKVIFEGKVREQGYKTISAMVTDDLDRLVGVISTFDILYHLRPAFFNYSVESISIWEGELEPFLEGFKDLTVGQIMTTPVLTISPDDHLMVVIDRMVKNKVRRLPVTDQDKLVGVVYHGEVFSTLYKHWYK